MIDQDCDSCFYNGQSKAGTFIQDTSQTTGLGAQSPSISSTAQTQLLPADEIRVQLYQMIVDLSSNTGGHGYKSHINNSVTAKLTYEDKKINC
jgi:hypothetical protein